MEFPDPIYAAIFERARPHLQTRHNEVHTRVSAAFALRLLAEEQGDPAVVLPGILLHDVGWSQVPEQEQLSAFGPVVRQPEVRRVHEREGARMAAEILEDLGYPKDAARQVEAIIDGHDSRLHAVSASDALVKDADKLFRLSREGFPIDCERFGLRPASHLAWLEEQIEAWFFTETGRCLAKAEAAARWRELQAEECLEGEGRTC